MISYTALRILVLLRSGVKEQLIRVWSTNLSVNFVGGKFL